MTSRDAATPPIAGPLGGFTVLEIGDERAEFCGRLLAGGHAEVVKVEPPGGNPTRRCGPFYEADGEAHSIYFWHYNLGKRSLTLDLEADEGRALLWRLAARADVLLVGAAPGYLEERGLGFEALAADHPGLVLCSITDFGPDGPWRDYLASDLIHLALGGQMMVCGYTPSGDFDPTNPGPAYDTPPIAPQMWQAYHTTGINAATAIYGALFHRELSGRGQRIEVSIHQAMAACTEFSVPYWIYNRRQVWRQTSSHAAPQIGTYQQRRSADGKLIFAMGSVASSAMSGSA